MGFEAPEDHELECGVDGEWVGEPGGAERIFHPGGRGGRGEGVADDTFGGEALDGGDGVEVWAVEEAAIGVEGVGCGTGLVGERGGDGRRVGEAGGEEDGGACVEGGAAAEFDEYVFDAVEGDGGSGEESEVDGVFFGESDAFEDTEVVEAVEEEAGVFVDGGVCEPFDDDGGGEYGFAFEDVGAEEGVGVEGEFSLEGEGGGRGGIGGGEVGGWGYPG